LVSWAPVVTFLLACFVVTIQTKIYRRCELAHVLKNNGMDGYEGYNLASWVCMAFYETGFDTKTIDRHKGGTKDYGIFHINSGLWCRESNSLSKAICDVACLGQFPTLTPHKVALCPRTRKNKITSGGLGIVRLFFGPHKTGEGQLIHTGESVPIKHVRMG
uniref:Sperm acrosome membrane-associated protein 3 n=1 Tax=Naja naja TaxID=35670 RepID=A0A8C6XCQ7_NAJNA